MSLTQCELLSLRIVVRGLENRCSDYERQLEEYRMRFQFLEDSGCDSESESETSDGDSDSEISYGDSDMDTDSSSGSDASESEY
jgi:hypothetical protein